MHQPLAEVSANEAAAPSGPDRRVIDLNGDARFIIPPGDPYWPPDIATRVYEPEVDLVLRRAASRPYAMIDAGANYGYWSVLASSVPYGAHRVVAIEPSVTNFGWLVRNAEANGGRFEVLRRAVSDRSGEKAKLYGRQHAGLSLRADWRPEHNDRVEEVETITLDEVAARCLPDRAYPPLIKLDVEGSETEAIKGARGLIDEGALVIFEDHGKETAHPASRFVLSSPELVLWHVDAHRRVSCITNLEQVAAIKTNPILGYNFFAHSQSSPWASIFRRPIGYALPRVAMRIISDVRLAIARAAKQNAGRVSFEEHCA